MVPRLLTWWDAVCKALYVAVFLIPYYDGQSQMLSSSNPVVNGVYITPSDFIHNKVSLLASNDNQNYLEQRLGKVILVREGKKYTFPIGKLSGYYKDGFLYRFYKNGYYKVLENADEVIYSKISSNNKTGAHTWYYHSTCISCSIKRMNKKEVNNYLSEIAISKADQKE